MFTTITLYNADCLPAMREMKDNQFSLSIVDPPYGIGDFRNDIGKAEHSVDKYDSVDWNNTVPSPEYFEQLYRVSQDQIIFGFQYFSPNIKPAGVIIHNKLIPFEMNLSMADIASCSLQNRVTVFEYRWQGMLQENMKNKQIRIHPCEKPIPLYTWILRNYAKKGDKILDTHGGSMGLAIACINAEISITVYESDKDHYQAGKKRVQGYINQGDIFRSNVKLTEE